MFWVLLDRAYKGLTYMYAPSPLRHMLSMYYAKFSWITTDETRPANKLFQYEFVKMK